jgi:NAD-dependent DNA ligase
MTVLKRQAFSLTDYRYVVRNNTLIVLKKDTPEIYGKNVVFTGELSEWTRERAESRARMMGATVQSNVTKSTDYIIIGLNPGTKLKQAVQNGAEIITDEQWNDMAKY